MDWNNDWMRGMGKKQQMNMKNKQQQKRNNRKHRQNRLRQPAPQQNLDDQEFFNNAFGWILENNDTIMNDLFN